MRNKAIALGAAFCGLSVILGAFGAHALKAMVAEDQLRIFETGVRYQFYHSLALIMCGILPASIPDKTIRLTRILFVIGILLFSGSLYLMTFLSTAQVGLGAVGILTPIGGLFFIAGWAVLAIGALRN